LAICQALFFIFFGGLCILRIRNIFSACAVWFTFISRTQEHRAVEDFISKGLLALVGVHSLVVALLPSLCFYYNILGEVCQALFFLTVSCYFSFFGIMKNRKKSKMREKPYVNQNEYFLSVASKGGGVEKPVENVEKY
jgi:hypothetical protein